MCDAAQTDPSAVPVYKVGAVLLRAMGDDYALLVVQPKPNPKKPGDAKPMGFVRGTRQYWDAAAGAWRDVPRDGLTGPAAGAKLEPVLTTFTRELAEEAGVSAAMLSGQRIYDMGSFVFQSVSKAPYPIHWFAVVLDEAAQRALPMNDLQDSLFSQWCSFAQMRELKAAGKLSPGYLAVAERALEGLRRGSFRRVEKIED